MRGGTETQVAFGTRPCFFACVCLDRGPQGHPPLLGKREGQSWGRPVLSSDHQGDRPEPDPGSCVLLLGKCLCPNPCFQEGAREPGRAQLSPGLSLAQRGQGWGLALHRGFCRWSWAGRGGAERGQLV